MKKAILISSLIFILLFLSFCVFIFFNYQLIAQEMWTLALLAAAIGFIVVTFLLALCSVMVIFGHALKNYGQEFEK